MSDDSPLERSAQEYVRERLAGRDPHALLVYAWEKFFTIYTETIRAFASDSGVPYGELDDFVQDIWFTVVRRLPQFELDADRGSLRTWVYTVVRNRALNLVRDRHFPAERVSVYDLPPDAEPGSLRDEPLRRLALIWEWYLLRTLTTALRDVTEPVNYRIFELRRLEGWPLSDIAAEVGLNTVQVRGRLDRVSARFRTMRTLYSGGALADSD